MSHGHLRSGEGGELRQVTAHGHLGLRGRLEAAFEVLILPGARGSGLWALSSQFAAVLCPLAAGRLKIYSAPPAEA